MGELKPNSIKPHHQPKWVFKKSKYNKSCLKETESNAHLPNESASGCETTKQKNMLCESNIGAFEPNKTITKNHGSEKVLIHKMTDNQSHIQNEGSTNLSTINSKTTTHERTPSNINKHKTTIVVGNKPNALKVEDLERTRNQRQEIQPQTKDFKLNLPRWGFSSKTTDVTARVLK